jgi:protein-disulfide isomerase
MSLHILRIAAAAAVLAACAKPGAAGHKSDTASPAAAVAATSTANGTVAPAAMPHDSISDRADRGRIAGSDTTAKLWVIMASDFQCPFCKQWHDAGFARLMRDYAAKGKIRLAFLNMPLSMHQNAMPAAEAAMCASVQDKFWPMHEALFENQQQWEGLQNPVPMFESLAGKAGVNAARWSECMTKHQTLALIQADRDKARGAGVNSTPTFFVGSQILAGADKDIAAAIDAALGTKPKAP